MGTLPARSVGVVLLLAFTILLYSFGIGTREFDTGDEARRALVIRSMVETGDYTIPRLSGDVYLKKPPLFPWLGALVSVASGSTEEWVYRLPSAVSAVLSSMVLCFLGSLLVSPRAGLLAGAVFATCWMVTVRGARARLDMTLACFVMLATWCLALARARDWRARWVFAFWACAGLAAMTKGPVGLLFPVTTALALAAIEGPFLARLRALRPLAGMLIVVAVCAPWCIAVVQSVGWDAAFSLVAEEAFGGFYLRRPVHEKPLYYYIFSLPSQLLPWSVFAPAALLALRERRSPGESSALRFAAAWLLPALAVLSLSASKRSFYLLPAYGAAALWLGWFFDRFVFGAPDPNDGPVVARVLRVTSLAVGWVALAAGVVAPTVVLVMWPDVIRSAAGFAIALLALGGVILLGDGATRPRRAVLALVAASALVIVAQRGVVSERRDETRSMRRLTETLAPEIPPGAEMLISHREYKLQYYLHRPVIQVESFEDLGERLTSGRSVFALLRESEFEEHAQSISRIVLRTRDPSRPGSNLVLVANR